MPETKYSTSIYQYKLNIDIRPSERQSRYGSLNLICPRYKRETEGASTFQVSAIRLWNSLHDIKCSSSITILKKTLHNHFIDSYRNINQFIIS